MSYSSTTIGKVLDQINLNYFLPAIQRPYVWESDQIIALFDSLLKGYPISSFLFWELRPENRSSWQIYTFVKNFRFGDTHNEQANPAGRDIVLVLDGQQRLTSFLIGLRGSYTVKAKHKRRNNPSAWAKQELYLDLFKDPNSGDFEEQEDLGITYGFKFFTETPINGNKRHWFKIGRILEFRDDDSFDTFKEDLIDNLPDQATKAQVTLARRNLDRLYRAVWKDEVIAYYTEKSQSYDRVLDIFIRANDGGTKLSKSDLLLSMITSKWNGVNARDEIYTLVDRLNTQLNRLNKFDKDFVLRSCLVISDVDHKYAVNNFTNEALSVIERRWPHICVSLENTVRLVNRFGIDRDTLTSTNALLPVAYYLSKIDSTLDDSTEFEVSNRERIRRMLLGALLNGAFSGASETTIGVSRQVVREAISKGRDFPYSELCEALLKRRGRVVTFDDNNLDGLLETRYSQKTAFLALSVLYDGQDWSSTNYHIDHIIPRSICSRQALQSLGISEGKIDRMLESVDRLGNLQLLSSQENFDKSSLTFYDWIRTNDGAFLERHLIPTDPHLWCPEMLLEFMEAREKLIRKRVASFGRVPTSSSGQILPNSARPYARVVEALAPGE